MKQLALCRYPTWRYVAHDGTRFILTDIRVGPDNGWHGPLLLARYKQEGDERWYAEGAFRIDTAERIEPIPEQLEIGAAA